MSINGLIQSLIAVIDSHRQWEFSWYQNTTEHMHLFSRYFHFQLN